MSLNKKEKEKEIAEAQAPICRLCLQERDFYGNLPTVYEDGITQHRTCMSKYSKNRRALKQVIFKQRYQEYLGDVRPAGLVDRKAMELIYGKSKKDKVKETITDRKEREKEIKRRCAYARKCKEEKRKKEEAEFNKTVEDFIKPAAVKIGSLIEESQNRE